MRWAIAFLILVANIGGAVADDASRWQVVPLAGGADRTILAILVDTATGNTWQLVCVATSTVNGYTACETKWMPLSVFVPKQPN